MIHKENIDLIEKMLVNNHPPEWKDYAQLRIWERGYLIGMLSKLMHENYSVRQAVLQRLNED
jgi:hypothetical protein